ncbi:hypothetical protein OCU04_004004 [Sclerotinia nivalis]|uniref:Uncharacterized protein n=1 Tax=Sclerotinia nivalis TaxID=352851 RepID=A0A9X0DPV8_9HELO|nr:hypothetical protein OCU04_004004 [Sclerotinia nivalis]
MLGYTLEFKRNYEPSTMALGSYELVWIGEVVLGYCELDAEGRVDGDGKVVNEELSVDNTPKTAIENEAAEISPPGRSENFRAKVNDVQWTMDLVRRLVEKGILEAQALEVVQAKRDPADHGIL